MRLPGILFILVGLVVTIVSWVVAQSGQKMTLFIVFGIAMAVYGAWKLFIDKNAPSEEEKRAKHREELSKQLPQGSRHNHEIPRICSVCRTRNHPKANFCGQCGNKL